MAKMKNRLIKIGILKKKQQLGGPQIFLKRLADSITVQKLAEIRNAYYPFFNVGLYNSVARNIYSKKYVLRLDGIYFDIKNKGGDSNKLNQPIFSSIALSSGIIFQSNFSKKLVESFYGKINKPFEIIINGAPRINNNENTTMEFDLPKDKIIFVASASWRRFKRLKEIVEIFLEVKSKYSDVALVVLGNNIDYQVHDDSIKYLNEIPHSKIMQIYQKCDIMLHLAWIDNCPNTVVEALSAGVPVICSNQGGTREIIELTNGGIISETDVNFKFEPVDLYNPPEINYNAVLRDIDSMINNLELYKSNISKKQIMIDYVAKKYVDYLTSIK